MMMKTSVIVFGCVRKLSTDNIYHHVTIAPNTKLGGAILFATNTQTCAHLKINTLNSI